MYLKLKSQVYEIFGYARDYLGTKGIDSENTFLQLAIKQLRLNTKIKGIQRKLRRIFRFKDKA
jgi:hypothetical protein